MPLNQRPHVHRCNLTLAHHHAAVDDGVVGVVAGAQQQRTHRVVHRTAGHAERVGAEQGNVGAIAGLDLSQLVGAAQHLRAAACGQAQGVAWCHLGGAAVTPVHGATVFDARRLHRPGHTRQQHGLAGFVQQMRRVVAGAAVHTQANRHTGVQHFAQGQDAAGQAHVAARAVGNAGAGFGKQVSAFVIQLHAMRVPHIVTHPA